MIHRTEIPFRERTLVFIDLETTGLSPFVHDIIEIAYLVVHHQTLKIEKEFTAKIAPAHLERADADALTLVGYTEEEWKQALSLSDVLAQLSTDASKAIPVGHVVHFDLMFLWKAYADCGLEYPLDYHYLDTVSLAYAKLQENAPTHMGLTTLCKIFQIKRERAHRAMDDIKATYELFKKLVS
ncbi:3'-5' exonuclease [Candidatus Kaiserbacteria bacterium]|nr:3'-5' exonuclease [Candidatus Kaiserbacteria bacterium]